MQNSVLRMPKERDLFFTTQVDQNSIATLTKSIIEINHDDEYLVKTCQMYGFDYTPKPIKIYIDSYGGHVYQILGVISIIEKSKTPIHTICTGCAMSCGFLLLISGHRRFAYRLSTPLYHSVSATASGQIKTLEEDVKEAKRLQSILEELTLKNTKINKKKLKDIYEKKIDWFMGAEEALKLKVIDEII